MAQQAETIAECPSCGSIVTLEATECPRCGELFAEEAVEVEAEPEPRKEGRAAGSREKLLFYVGIALIVVGGPGIAFGSWLHDLLRIPYENYDAFDVFGPMNRLVSAVGLIVLVVGIVFLILSLRLTRSVEPDYDVGAPRGS